MNHCLAQLFRVGLPARLPERDFVSRSVIFQNQRMIHRDICRSLFKVAYRVAPRGHHIAEQLVRCCNRTGWTVDEPRLDFTPGLHEARTIACRQRPDVKALDSLCTLFEAGFGMPPVAAFFHRSTIFSVTELSAQFFSPALSVRKEQSDASDQNHDESND